MSTSLPSQPAGAALPATPARPRKAARVQRGPLIGANLGSAVEALWANRLRSILTALGIIIGVAAVIGAVTVTQGASILINQRIAGLGTNQLTILNGSTNTGGVKGGQGTSQSLTQADADTLANTVPHLVAVSPVQAVTTQIIAGSQNWNAPVDGVYPNEAQIGNWTLQTGAWFTQNDEDTGKPVAVIGQTVLTNLFPGGASPVGQSVLIHGQAFQIVGVLATKGTTGFQNQDNVVYVPFNAAVARLKNSQYVSQIQVLVDNPNDVTQAQTDITSELETLHHLPAGGPDDFSVRNPTQFVQTAQTFATTLTVLLVSVAAISLIVGGIGIMNIMLVSVTERTREIGIRMAIGARRGDIRNQFLIEALTLSAAGGVLGVLIGLTVGYVLTNAAGLPFAPSPESIIGAFVVSAGVGIVFGFYPAVRASGLDPIVALRME